MSDGVQGLSELSGGAVGDGGEAMAMARQADLWHARASLVEDRPAHAVTREAAALELLPRARSELLALRRQ